MIFPNNNTVLDTIMYKDTDASRITLGICVFIFSRVIMENLAFLFNIRIPISPSFCQKY